jgi:hypothetical protein
MAAVAFLGIVAFPFLPVAPLPQVDFPTISVTATLSGASAETMASSVAAPLERQFGQIANFPLRARRQQRRHPVRPQPQHRCGGPGRAGGNYRREQVPAAGDDATAELSQGEPRRIHRS